MEAKSKVDFIEDGTIAKVSSCNSVILSPVQPERKSYAILFAIVFQ